MIDGIQSLSLSTSCDLLKHPGIDWYLNANNSTGEVKSYWAKYKGLYLTAKNQNIALKGSIHKFFNGGADNNNDFTYTNIVEVIDVLCQELGVNAETTRINNVEFGVNVNIDYTELVKHLVKCYQKKELLPIDITGKKLGIRADLEKYSVKIYDKGLGLTRFEIHVGKMQYLTARKDSVPLTYFSDLVNPGIYPKLKSILLEVIDSLLFMDKSKVPELDSLKASRYQYGEFWCGLNSDQRTYHRKKFNDMMDSRGANWMHKKLKNLVSEKWDELFFTAKVPGYDATDEITAKVPVCVSDVRQKYPLDKMYFYSRGTSNTIDQYLSFEDGLVPFMS